MSEPLRHFLIVFDHERAELVGDIDEYEDASQATDAYTETEQKYSTQDRVEVVLLGSDSIDTVKRTHPQYFASGVSNLTLALEELLRGAALGRDLWNEESRR